MTGTGFTMSGVTFPATLTPGQTATLDLQFDPATSGAATGLVTLSDNVTGAATATIALNGTGISATGYQVQLTWNAPESTTDPAVGYNIYRAANGSATYTLLNSSVNTPTTFTDTTVQDGTTYTYEVTSVDASGVQSVPSNPYTAAIP
jgi:fibronectin type 3 domain-containing protein